MIQKGIFLIILYCGLLYPAKAQNVNTTFDRAEVLLQTDIDSSVQLIEQLGNRIGSYSPEEQLTFHHKAAAFYGRIANFRKESLHWEQSLPLLPKGSDTLYSTLLHLGMAQLNAGEFKSSKVCFERCKRYYMKTKNKQGIVQSYNGIASVLTAAGDCKAAVDHYFDAIRILETMDDYIQLTRTYSNLSIAYNVLGEKRKALEVRQKSYHYALLSKDEEEIHFGELNLGGSYNETGQPDSAAYYLTKSLAYYEKHFNAQILNAIYNELGKSYSMTRQDTEAESYYLKSIDLLKTGGFDFALPGTLSNYGLVLFHKGEYKKGIQVCQEALPIARKIGYLEVEMITCNCLYMNFKADKQADSALVYYEYQVALRDSIANAEIQKATLRKELETVHTMEKEGIISNANEELSVVLNFRNVLIIGSSILLLALLILFYSFRQKKRSVAYIEREKQYLDDLVHNLVHEFRTPLTLIKGQAEELQKTDERNALLQLINKNSDRMLNLVNQVLDFSKLKAGKLALSEEVTDLNLFLVGTLDLFSPLALQKNISLQYTPSPDPSVVMIDSDKLFKVVSNLLSNAIKYSGDGSDVHLTCARENNRLMITIQDTGIGIPPEELKNVFLKFYQVDATTTRKEEGTGLGLAFVDELIRLMKGTIELSSIPDKGTTVRVGFPFVPASLKQTTTVPSPDPVAIQSVSHDPEDGEEQKHRVLVIDDNADLQVFLRMILEEQGYDVSIAENGEAGIEIAIETVPDIIISDVMMPKKDGYQVVQALKEHPATDHIPIILLTAKASFDSMIGGLQTGADDYLSKPFKSQELLLRVNNHIRHQLKLQEKYLSSTPREEQPVIKHSLISKIESIVQEEDGIHCTVEQIAGHCAMSRSQLHRKVKFLTGLSTTALLTKVRLDLALEDVTGTDMTISEISYKFGYSDPANFSRLFKKQFHKSPSEFRNSPV